MSDLEANLAILEEQITAIEDTRNNLVGLVEKMAGTQLALDEAGFPTFSAGVGNAFADLSNAAQQLESIAHDADLERNRIRNEDL